MTEELKELREHFVDEYTPYDSWEEFIHKKEQYEEGNYEAEGQ